MQFLKYCHSTGYRTVKIMQFLEVLANLLFHQQFKTADDFINSLLFLF